MPLMVSGRVRHCQLQPDQVHAMLSKHIPGIYTSVPDFAVDRNGCKIEFFCNSSSILDFTVTLTTVGGPAPAAVTLLAREAQSANEAVLKALGRRFRRAKIGYCYLEDEKSRGNLLTWSWEKPLRSRPAKLAYLLCAMLLALGGVLTYITLRQPPSASRTDAVISLALAILLSVLALPLPFVFEHLKTKGNGRWIYLQNGAD
jgi:hypothetical protein